MTICEDFKNESQWTPKGVLKVRRLGISQEKGRNLSNYGVHILQNQSLYGVHILQNLLSLPIKLCLIVV
jgi:hypothetical protein